MPQEAAWSLPGVPKTALKTALAARGASSTRREMFLRELLPQAHASAIHACLLLAGPGRRAKVEGPARTRPVLPGTRFDDAF